MNLVRHGSSATFGTGLNVLFSFLSSYQAHGGKAKTGLPNVENGGPGTAFLYHLVHTHRTLLFDNDGGKPLNKHMNYEKLDEEGKTSFLFIRKLDTTQRLQMLV